MIPPETPNDIYVQQKDQTMEDGSRLPVVSFKNITQASGLETCILQQRNVSNRCFVCVCYENDDEYEYEDEDVRQVVFSWF